VAELRCGGRASSATRRSRSRPARRLNLRRSGARVATGRTIQSARQPAHPVVEGGGERGIVACKPDCHGAPNTRMKLTRRPSLALGSLASSLGAQLMRHTLGAYLAKDGARRAGLSSRPQSHASVPVAWWVAKRSGWNSVAQSAQSFARRAPARCGPTSVAERAEPRCGARGSSATRRLRSRPARRLNLRRSGARVAKGRTIRIVRQPAHPVVKGVV
jgi:hypothetical protein